MMPRVFTPLIQKAISFAIQVHELDQQQRRKGKDIPYIIHPLSVAIILAKVSDDDQIIAAGILHDVIEDCHPYGSVISEVLVSEFGEKVGRIVSDLTEPDKSVPWSERKRHAIAHIKDMDRDSLLVKAADVLHNLADMSEDVHIQGEDIFKIFTAGRDGTMDRYHQVVNELEKAWPENPLLSDLKYYLNSISQ